MSLTREDQHGNFPLLRQPLHMPVKGHKTIDIPRGTFDLGDP